MFETLKSKFQVAKLLSPAHLKELGQTRLSELILRELGKSRERVATLEKRYPSAPPREVAAHLIESKKALAGMVGGVTGIFGLASIPADLLVMTWLQLILLTDIATVYKVNLKSDRARGELLDLFGYANGLGPFQRASPRVLGKLAGALLEKGGMKVVGRAVPMVAAPISAYLNNQHVQSVGDEAIRYYEGFDKAREKTKRRPPRTRAASSGGAKSSTKQEGTP